MLSLLGTLYFLVGLACSTLCLLCVLLTFLGYLKKPRDSVEEENFYYQSEAEVKVPVYCISKEPIVDLSVVIPAYNEVARLPLMLEETVDFLKARVAKNTGFKYEIIVVDDGSKDKTADCALDFAKKANLKKGELVVVKLAINRGKGGAVAQGILRAKGKNILFADADGATRFSDVSILEEALAKLERKGLGLVVGSRSHLVNSEAVVKVTQLFCIHQFFSEITLTKCTHVWISYVSIRSWNPRNQRYPMWIQTLFQGCSTSDLLQSSCRGLDL
ncbi:dolichyl-phosphate beta-glucosyltransferase, variant 2 [Entomophthora muscae]|uniref:Dolichyl-phosphate beta-glucosyltransferase, variant 2 n=1 Tax=Entomophthora muscae TaxID=34485 RepID=A0ACC2RQZ6_9FUNG|nr:dolichyl-phosphate beta-glucosyltransferase, variant 2 [Entomophthora muscae]